MDNESKELKSIDAAIESCQKMEQEHSYSARRILSIVFMLTITLIIIVAVVFLIPFLFTLTLNVPESVLYVFLAIYTLTFSILMAVYRLHLRETARIQHHKIGFMRIRVAGNNSDLDGYKSEVRESLTKNAFEYQYLSAKKGQVESPVPGHPASEITTAVLNKVLDGIEIVTKRDKKST